jgi:hypothetical protein
LVVEPSTAKITTQTFDPVRRRTVTNRNTTSRRHDPTTARVTALPARRAERATGQSQLPEPAALRHLGTPAPWTL